MQKVKMNFICLFLLVFSLWISINAQEEEEDIHDECKLPNGLIGFCVPTKNCTFGNNDWQYQAYSLPISFWDHVAERDSLCPQNDFACCEPENLFKPTGQRN